MEKPNELGINKQNKSISKNTLSLGRWNTYEKLIKCAIQIQPSNILEIGIRNRIVSDVLEKLGFHVKTLDIDKSFNPDFLVDIKGDDILKIKEKFDLIIASQVFEHLEYAEFLKVLHKISSVSQKLLITLPYMHENSLFFALSIRLPLLKRKKIKLSSAFKYYTRKLTHSRNPEHHWEIGLKGFPLRRIKKDIKKNGWLISRHFLNIDNPYHYFFILTSKNKK